ncbi:MAG: hypothetical protein HC887_02430 [Desulfobacteraceae bacterium]|nr:hypothetical protein [Desulfobacteraceae bacterium]
MILRQISTETTEETAIEHKNISIERNIRGETFVISDSLNKVTIKPDMLRMIKGVYEVNGKLKLRIYIYTDTEPVKEIIFSLFIFTSAQIEDEPHS